MALDIDSGDVVEAEFKQFQKGTKMESQKIIKLTAENVKRLKAVEITPDGGCVVIGGNNAQGKTSVLDSIAMALGGKTNIPGKPIRDGQEKASVIVETDQLVVTRVFTSGGSRVEIKNKDGLKFSSPQSILDALVGSIAFDPLEFSRKPAKEQLETLRDVCGIDTEEIENEIRNVFESRKLANAEVKRSASVLESLVVFDDAPMQEKSAADLYSELEAVETDIARRCKLEQELTDSKERSMEIVAEIEQLKSELEESNICASETADEIRKFSDRIKSQRTADEIRSELAGVDSENKKYRANEKYSEAKKEHEVARCAADDLTAVLEKLRKRRTDTIKKASLPVDGLGFGDGFITYNGIPFDQASGAEQLRASVAIGSALNKGLNVLLVRDGSLLDKENLEELSRYAKESGCQIWVERVSDGDECSVIIEDGEVKK